ncbi:hypothetical protein O1611_g9310 [Lasiodiplodia mahajangana]|uniref:Uncharacterized protein n=1 Tax=Lasiodiplodia mahajangana TaxID=1108764 RepID=A0ACC2JA83_9PEZI|nr:hypothetical protein O1611_g9310 [Lasiodiplodia mahajangana]
MSSSISRLPDSATRLLSSDGVVVTPIQLVKELLDNAIDAKATSVEILVSSDTISRIEIRDDGIGIHPDDFDALGRRGHTSKLRSIEELGSIVGKSLGFRGEALASVNSMADVAITTKTSTEPVAAVLELKPNDGGVLTQKSTSAPVGTTVTVINLFCRQPVRKQVATKEAKKTLGKLQELLRSYAMARPQLKLQFKVLQTSTKTWSYSPKHNAVALEAVLQLFGAEAASKCFIKTFQTGHSGSDSGPSAQNLSGRATTSFVLEALLVNPDTDLQKAPKGHYFSVDGRPINSGCGVAKRLLNVYIEYLNLSTVEKGISNCFIRLDICCPPGTYDANIEPSKDKVLFSDEEVIIDTFRRLCSEIYKPTGAAHQETSGTTASQAHGIPTINSLGQDQLHPLSDLRDEPRDFPLISSQTSLKVPPGVSCQNSDSINLGSQETQASTGFRPINAEYPPNLPHSRGSGSRRCAAPSTLNRCKIDTSAGLNEHHELNYRQCDERAPATSNSQETRAMDEVSLLTPDRAANDSPVSPLTPEPPILRHIMAPPGDLEVPRSYKDADRAKLRRSGLPTVPGGHYRNPMATPPNSSPVRAPVAPSDHSHIAIRRHRRERLPWTPPSSIKRNSHTDALQTDLTHIQGTDGFRQTQISFTGPQASRRRARVQGDAPQSDAEFNRPPIGLDVDAQSNTQDTFSKAKQNLRYQLSQMVDGELEKVDHKRELQRYHQRSPHQRQPFSIVRPNKFKSMEATREDREPIPTTLPTGDPRAYLLRRQKSAAAEESGAKPKAIRRVKSSLMPLENIPPEYCTLSLSWSTSISSSGLEELVKLVRKYDEYVIYGALVDGLDMSLADGRVVESRLQSLLTEQKENISNGVAADDQIIINLQATLKGKGVGVAQTT